MALIKNFSLGHSVLHIDFEKILYVNTNFSSKFPFSLFVNSQFLLKFLHSKALSTLIWAMKFSCNLNIL